MMLSEAERGGRSDATDGGRGRKEGLMEGGGKGRRVLLRPTGLFSGWVGGGCLGSNWLPGNPGWCVSEERLMMMMMLQPL